MFQKFPNATFVWHISHGKSIVYWEIIFEKLVIGLPHLGNKFHISFITFAHWLAAWNKPHKKSCLPLNAALQKSDAILNCDISNSEKTAKNSDVIPNCDISNSLKTAKNSDVIQNCGISSSDGTKRAIFSFKTQISRKSQIQSTRFLPKFIDPIPTIKERSEIRRGVAER